MKQYVVFWEINKFYSMLINRASLQLFIQKKRMRARERGSEGVGLGYGDIGFIDVYNKVVQETCKIN